MRLKARTRLFALILFLLIPAAHASAQNCLSYDTDGVRLSGTISKKTFPGPPNYESIRKGDKPETYWILHLTKPICTIASGDNDAENNVTDLQLILPVMNNDRAKEDYAKFKKLAGQNNELNVEGRLMHAITGHHHTPVLVEVRTVAPNKSLQF